MRKGFRAVALVATVALVAGAFFAAPAEAAKKGPKKKKAVKCSAFTAGIEEAKEAKVVPISKKATEAAPVKIEYEHGMAGPSNPVDGSQLFNEWLYFNIQVTGPSSGLYIKQEFSDRHDIDLYLYDAAGEEVTHSGGFNPAPVGPFSSGGNAGTNYESISGVATSTCTGYTIGSNAYLTNGTDVTLSIWFGEVKAEE
jgi:hypothetical protein